MPRTSRFDVLFNAHNTQWLAHFDHLHDSTKGIEQTFVDEHDRPIITKVKHVTLCSLRNTLSGETFEGVANCSMKDEYDWRKGVKMALSMAVEEVHDGTGLAKGEMLNAFFKEQAIREGQDATT